MILITGAGGKTGRALVKALAKVGSVCAFVHYEGQVSPVKSLGAQEIIVGDMRDESAIRSAMQNVKTIYHMCPNMSPEEVVIGTLIIEEARRASVEHFVYHSVLHPQTERMQHHWQKLRVEEMVFESGIPFTILQPAPYMQNLLAGWKSIIEEGVLRVPYSVHSPFSFVDLEDVAEAAKTVLAQPDHRNATYELAGTPPMSHVDVADVVGSVLKQNIRAEELGTGSWIRRAEQSGLSEYARNSLMRMFTYYSHWGLVGNPNVLRWLLNREPTSLQEFFRRTLEERDEIH